MNSNNLNKKRSAAIVINKNGLLCEKKNFKDLSNKIEILIKDKKLRTRMKIFSRMYAYKHYNVNVLFGGHV